MFQLDFWNLYELLGLVVANRRGVRGLLKDFQQLSAMAISLCHYSVTPSCHRVTITSLTVNPPSWGYPQGRWHQGRDLEMSGSPCSEPSLKGSWANKSKYITIIYVYVNILRWLMCTSLDLSLQEHHARKTFQSCPQMFSRVLVEHGWIMLIMLNLHLQLWLDIGASVWEADTHRSTLLDQAGPRVNSKLVEIPRPKAKVAKRRKQRCHTERNQTNQGSVRHTRKAGTGIDCH